MRDGVKLTKPSQCSADEPQTLIQELQTTFDVNVIGVINTVNTFISLLRKGQEKKVLTISSFIGDADFINQVGISIAAPYSVSKAALNVAVATYNALYKSEGILFMAVSPGVVATGDKSPSELISKRPPLEMRVL